MTQLIQTITTIIPIIAMGGAAILSYGKLKASIVSQKECKENQKFCNKSVSDSIIELKKVIVDNHDKQTLKIEALQSKLEDTNVTIGKIQGYLSSLKRS